VVLAGDILCSDEPTILRSAARRLLSPPPGTVAHTAHEESATVVAEAPLVRELVARSSGPST